MYSFKSSFRKNEEFSVFLLNNPQDVTLDIGTGIYEKVFPLNELTVYKKFGSTYLLSQHSNLVLAMDNDWDRLQQCKLEADKLGLKNILPIYADYRDSLPKVIRVLKKRIGLVNLDLYNLTDMFGGSESGYIETPEYLLNICKIFPRIWITLHNPIRYGKYKVSRLFLKDIETKLEFKNTVLDYIETKTKKKVKEGTDIGRYVRLYIYK